MPLSELSLDYETFSTLDLPTVGSSRYSRHKDTEVLMAAYQIDGGPVLQWDAAQGQKMPSELAEALVDPEVVKWAWNSPFEQQITQHVLKLPVIVEQWRDTMVMAHACSFPGKLEKVGPIIDIPVEQQKIADGKRLINKFSKPKTSRKRATMGQLVRTYWFDDLEDWQNYLDYNRGDVITETAIRRRLNQFRPMPDHEWELWHLDQKINAAGIPINLNMVRNAVKTYEAVLRDSFNFMSELTGLKNPNSTQQILPWLKSQGYMFDDMQKAHVKTARSYFDIKPDHWEDDQWDEYKANDTLKEILDLRLETSRTSIKKYAALLDRTDDDGNLRNAFQFAGAARTWRWAGRGWQGQNLPRPEKIFEKGIVTHAQHVEFLDYNAIKLVYGNLFDLLASCLRSTAQAPDGYMLVDRDLNAIENRVLGWIAQCPKILRVFKLNRDPYIDFATYLFGGTYDTLWAEYKAGNSVKRTISKPGVLGCLSSETPVLTNYGWKAIVEVSATDLLWDGVQWVRHSGVAYKGSQETLCGSGVYATSDHKFLTREGWVEWRQVCQPQMLQSAVDTATGLFLRSRGRHAAPESVFSAAANVELSEKSLGQTLFGGYRPAAPDALLLTVAPISENELGRDCLTYSQIVTTLRDRVARTKKIRLSSITGVGEFVCGSKTVTTGFNISLRTLALTEASNVIESEMTEITRGGTCDLQLDLNRTRISETWDVLNSGVNSRFAVLTADGVVIAHNCGYMLGPGDVKVNRETGEIEGTGLLGYAWDMGIKQFTKEQSVLSVEVFRREFEEVKEYWYGIEKAAKKTITTGRSVKYGQGFGAVTFDMHGPFLRMRLPSGRCLHYCRPRIEPQKTPWGEVRDTITYEGLNDRKQWVRQPTHPGKLTENADQAIARDLLAHAMLLCHRRGLDLRIHVHDQAVALALEGNASNELEIMRECMETPPPWGPDMPLGSAGFITKVWMKD